MQPIRSAGLNPSGTDGCLQAKMSAPFRKLPGCRGVKTAVTYIHVLNRDPGAARSPVDILQQGGGSC